MDRRESCVIGRKMAALEGLDGRRESSNVCVEGANGAMKHRVSEVEAEHLAQDCKDLWCYGDDELKEKWRDLYGIEPPGRIHRSLLIPAIAYRLQENVLGALPPSIHRHLMRISEDAALGNQSPDTRTFTPRAGSVFVREWGGVTHQVKVLEDGVLFRSKRYKSLSEVARVITGAHWSGPLFFGLRSARKEPSHAAR